MTCLNMGDQHAESIVDTPHVSEQELSEKDCPTTHEIPLASTEEELDTGAITKGNCYWHPGVLSRFPWLGFAALCGVILCLGASTLVLALSNHKTQTKTYWTRAWPKAVAPNVLISIFSSLSSILFGIAISETLHKHSCTLFVKILTSLLGNGIAIAWWRRVSAGGTIKDLNRSWQFSSSMREILLSGKAFNTIALTALVAKMTLVDSALLQKAIGTYTMEEYIGQKPWVVYGYINETFPSTGIGLENSSAGSVLQDWFNQDIRIWQTGGGVYPNQFSTYKATLAEKKNKITGKTEAAEDYFNGSVAYTRMNGAGLQFDCLDPVTEWINISALASPLQNNSTGSDRQLLFAIDFTVHHGFAGTVPESPGSWMNNTDYIVMKTAYSRAHEATSGTNVGQCHAELISQTCRLRAAVIAYPVELSQRGQEMSWTARTGTDDDYDDDAANFYHFNQTEKQQNYFFVDHVIDLKDYPDPPSPSGKSRNNTYSGLAVGLQMSLGAYAFVSRSSSLNSYDLNHTGAAQTYPQNVPLDGQCNYNFSSPIDGGEDLLGPWLSNGPKSEFVDPGLVGKINSIMFGLATDVAGLDPNNNYNDQYFYNASMWADTVHYKSNFSYMGGAIASTLLCILCVLPSYYGYWELGRKVTLGPFEIAAAFRAPDLHHAMHANAPVDKLMEEIGERRVQFGQIVGGEHAGRIGIADAEYVVRV